MTEITLAAAVAIGFTHAFEADHLVAVGNLVTRRDRVVLAAKDGMYWGLGHTSTILLFGMLVILGRQSIDEEVFTVLEAVVGGMLILLGVWRISGALRRRKADGPVIDNAASHRLAYGVGLVHGLAGSGALLMVVVAAQSDPVLAILHLSLFGLGSVGGMLVAAGLLSLPFARRGLQRPGWQFGLVLASGIACFLYGGYVVAEQLGVLI